MFDLGAPTQMGEASSRNRFAIPIERTDHSLRHRC
jgi:hypothetical protein